MSQHSASQSPPDHGHGDLSEVSDARLIWAVILNLLLTIVEAALGVLAGSLMLLADALHNFNDCGSLVIALVARRISRREADRRFTFGYRRAELIGAIVNITTLVIIGIYLVYEAIVRFIAPQPVEGKLVMIAAGVALVVDVLTAVFLRRMARGSLNVKAAFVHNVSDAFSSLAVLVGGAVIVVWGWTDVDPILTIGIAGYVIFQSVSMFKRGASILMNASPSGTDVRELAEDLEAMDGVIDIHHVHVWELDEHKQAMEAHVVIAQSRAGELEAIKKRLKDLLERRFDIEHCTLEFEFADGTGGGRCADSGPATS